MNNLIQIIGTTLALSCQYRSLAVPVPNPRIGFFDEPFLRPGALVPPIHHEAFLQPRWMSGLGAESSQWDYGGYELKGQPEGENALRPEKMYKRSQLSSKPATSPSSVDHDSVTESGIVLGNPNMHSQLPRSSRAVLEPSEIVLKRFQESGGLSPVEKGMLSRRADRTNSPSNINPSQSDIVLSNPGAPSNGTASDSAALTSKIVLGHPLRPRASSFSNTAVSGSVIVLRKNQRSSNVSLSRRASDLGSETQRRARYLKRTPESSSSDSRSSETTVTPSKRAGSQGSSSSQVTFDSKIVLSNRISNKQSLNDASNLNSSSSSSLEASNH